MKTMTFRRRFALLSVLLAFAICLASPPRAFSQDSVSGSKLDKSLVKELDELRAKVRRLEAILGRNGRPKASMAKKGMGMGMGKKISGKGMGMGKGMAGKGMGMGKKMAGKGMGMGGKKMGKGKEMAGKGMMGRGPRMGGMPMQSALPGFPGASHIYHIGETGFFLTHSEHITITADQQKKLNDIKTRTLLADATFERQIDEAEQQLWKLTAAAEPDIAKIEANVREIARLTGNRRLAFIRGVGEAAAVLTDDQRQDLVGEHAPQGDQSDSINSNE